MSEETIYVAHAGAAKLSPVIAPTAQECAEKATERFNLEYRASDIDNWSDIHKKHRSWNPMAKMYHTNEWFDRVAIHEHPLEDC